MGASLRVKQRQYYMSQSFRTWALGSKRPSVGFSQVWDTSLISLRFSFFLFASHMSVMSHFTWWSDKISLVNLISHLTVGNPTFVKFQSSREQRMKTKDFGVRLPGFKWQLLPLHKEGTSGPLWKVTSHHLKTKGPSRFCSFSLHRQRFLP